MIYRSLNSTASLASRNEQRMGQSFESHTDAEERVKAHKRIHSHVGPWSSYIMDWEACLREVDSYPNDKDINFSNLAKTFKITNSSEKFPDNGG